MSEGEVIDLDERREDVEAPTRGRLLAGVVLTLDALPTDRLAEEAARVHREAEGRHRTPEQEEDLALRHAVWRAVSFAPRPVVERVVMLLRAQGVEVETL